MGISIFPVAAAAAGVTQKVQEFTSSGTFTVPSNCSSVEVFLVGGGGGGGRAQNTGASVSFAGSGGGGGGAIRRTITVTPSASITVTIGGGGAGATGNSAGATGTTTSFGSLSVLGGGGGGSNINNSNSPRLYYGPTVGATIGGGNAKSNFGTGTAGGCGGGAGGNATVTLQSATSGFMQPAQVTTRPTFGGSGVNAGEGPAGYMTAGMGIDGYGNGGPGGYAIALDASLNNGYAQCLSSSSSLPTRWDLESTLYNGNAATANTGDGGGGGRTGPTTGGDYAGQNGGSGYVTVTYWS
jgi:hypothetical protein